MTKHPQTTSGHSLFASLAEITPAGVYILAGGRFRLVSDAFCAFTGYTRAELLALDPWTIIAPQDREHVRAQAVKRLRSGDTSPYRFQAVAKDGSPRWIVESVRSVTFEGTRATLGSFFDITEFKRSADALRESDAQLRFLAETSRDVIFIHRIRPARAYEYISPSCEALFGFAPQDFYAAPDLLARITLPDDLPLLNRDVSRPDSAESPPRIRVVRKDGRVIWIETRVSYERDPAGKPLVARGIIRDVTDSVQANRALRRSEESFRAIAEHSKDVIYRYHYQPQRGYEYMSPSALALYGYSPADFYNDSRLLTKIVHPDDRKLLEDRPSGRARSAEPATVRIITKDGKMVWIERRVSYIYDDDGALVAAQGITRDITDRVEAQEALRARGEIFRLLAENSGDMIYRYRMTEPYGYEYVSPAGAAIFGYTPEEFYADPKITRKLWAPEQADAIHNEVSDLDKSWQALVLPAQHKNGAKLWVEVSRRCIFDDQGALSAVEGVIRNVTQRVEAEQSLRKREETFRLLAENAHDMIYRYRMTEPVGYEYVSPACERIYGLTPEDFYADPHITRKYWLKDDIPDLMKRTGKLSSDWTTFTHRSLRTDGAVIWVEVTRRHLFDGSGRLAAVEGVIRDVTERMQQLQELDRRRTLLNQLVMSTPDALIVADPEGRIILANPACHDLLKKAEDSLAGVTLSDALPLPELSSALTAGRHVTNLELRYQESGADRYLIASVIPMHSPEAEGGAGDLYLVILHDATMERASQAALYHTARLASIGEMAAGVAHEINNPLTSVLGYSELISTSPALPQSLRRDILTIKANAERASHIVRNLLAFGRPYKLQRAPVNINDALASALQLRSYELKAGNIQVVTRLQPDLPRIIGDGNQLQQVFINIIINAEHAMLAANGKGVLVIATAKAGERVSISFADDGPGMTPDVIAKIFDPFFTTKEPGKGTGLGLSISHTIIKAHGGDISAISSPGKGATFLITLPAQEAEQKTP